MTFQKFDAPNEPLKFIDVEAFLGTINDKLAPNALCTLVETDRDEHHISYDLRQCIRGRDVLRAQIDVAYGHDSISKYETLDFFMVRPFLRGSDGLAHLEPNHSMGVTVRRNGTVDVSRHDHAYAMSEIDFPTRTFLGKETRRYATNTFAMRDAA